MKKSKFQPSNSQIIKNEYVAFWGLLSIIVKMDYFKY